MEFKERKHGFGLSDIAFRLSGKKAVVETEVIHGKRLNIIFTFFNKANYERELRDWLDFQKKRLWQRESGQKVEGFKILEGMKKKPRISYGEFIKTAVPFFSRIIFEAFSDNPSFFGNMDETIIQIKVERAERWEYDRASKEYSFEGAFPYSTPDYFVHKAMQSGLLDLDHYFIAFSGFYILQAIVAPYVYLHRIDYNFFYKYLTHEIEHYHSYAMGYYHPEFELEKSLGPHMAASSDYTLLSLQKCLSDLRNEGFADFRKKRFTTRIQVVPRIIRNFRNLVRRIPQIRKKQGVSDFYEKEIYAGSMEGVYYCGYIMAFFITYSLDPRFSKIVFNNGSEAGLEQLSKAFDTEKEFYITPPSPKAYDEAMNIINNSDAVAFLKRYEEACARLGLNPDSMVLTMSLFKQLWNEAEYIFEKEELAKIRKENYYPAF